MAITEQNRHRLHRRLEVIVGEEEAATLMEHLPPVGWADVATTTDLDHLRVVMRADLERVAAELRTELHGAVAELRTEFYGAVAELRTELHGAVAELRTEIAQLRGEMYKELGSLRAELHRTLRVHTLFLVGTNLSAIGLVAAFVGR